MSTQHRNFLRIAVLSALLIVSIPVVADTPEPDPAATPAAEIGRDSPETRIELSELLRRCPPELGGVLKLDPTLLGNRAYLEAYPALANFVAAHPEIVRHPDFFLADVSIPDPSELGSPGARMAMDVLGGLAGLSVFLVVTGVLAWLVKTLIAQKRWRHLSRVQTEVHGKLLDRLSSSEELLAYIQTPAGRRFLESAPIPVDDVRPALGAPIARILGSVQAGVVIAAAGVGLQLISRGLPEEVSRPIFAVGIFAISVGAGFVLAAIVSFVISRKLGLWTPPAVGGGRDAGA